MTNINKILFSLFIASFFITPTFSQDNIIDEIVWVVGDEAILKSDVEGVKLQMQLEKQQIDGDPYCVIPEQLAVQKLFLHQAKADSIDVSMSSVNRTVDARINNAISSLGSKEKLEEYLGKSVVDLRDEWREQSRDNEIIREVQQKIVGNIKLTPSQIRNFYTALPADSLPFIPLTVEVQTITMEPKIPITEIDAVKNRLRDFTNRVNKKETDFATLALLYSEDVESAKRGGELGFMGRAELVPAFANVAFSLRDPGKVSNIVESEYGYHIIQLVDRKDDKVNVRHILLKPKVPANVLTETTARMDTLVRDIHSEKYTFEQAAPVVSFDKQSRNNEGIMLNMNQYSNNYGTSRFEMKDLPIEVSRVVNTLSVDSISEPFTMLDTKGKQIVAIVKVKQRVSPHRANLTDDYQVIKGMVESQQKEEKLKKWVQDKINTTYIRIDPNWSSCDFLHTGWIKNNTK